MFIEVVDENPSAVARVMSAIRRRPPTRMIPYEFEPDGTVPNLDIESGPDGYISLRRNRSLAASSVGADGSAAAGTIAGGGGGAGSSSGSATTVAGGGGRERGGRVEFYMGGLGVPGHYASGRVTPEESLSGSGQLEMMQPMPLATVDPSGGVGGSGGSSGGVGGGSHGISGGGGGSGSGSGSPTGRDGTTSSSMSSMSGGISGALRMWGSSSGGAEGRSADSERAGFELLETNSDSETMDNP